MRCNLIVALPGWVTGALLRQKLMMSGLLLLLAGCAAGPPVTISQNPDSDFTKFRTYAFAAPLSIAEPDVRDRLSPCLIEATANELAVRGLTRSDNPDIRIDYTVQTVAKQRAWEAPSSAPINSGIGRRSGWSNVDTSYAAKQTTKDTISIRVIDAQRKTVAWEASAREYITHKDDAQLAAAVTEFVSFLLVPFPISLDEQR